MINQKHFFTFFLVATTIAGCCKRTNLPPECVEIIANLEIEETELTEPDFGAEDPLQLAGHPWIGAINAPVTIVVFSDFECPYCSRGAERIHEILELYPTQVRVVFKQMPLPMHSNANLAAQASLAAHAQGNEFFWQYHDLLFENRLTLERSNLEEYAEQIGLDMETFRAALDNETFAEVVAADIAHAAELGIRGTPNFLINGTNLRGARPLADFQTTIDAELEAIQVLINGMTVGEAFAAQVEENLQGPEPIPEPPRRPQPPRPDLDAELYIPIGESPVFGPADALVTIVAFSEFQCPYCSRVLATMEQIKEEFGDDVRIVFKHRPLGFHDRAEPAARATIAAQNQGKFWEMHDLLFANQRALTDENFDAFAEQLGLNIEQFHTDMQSEATTARIQEDLALAERVQANGTPHFFINGMRLSGAQPFPRFQSVINEQLIIAQNLIDAGTDRTEIYQALQADAIRGPVPMIQANPTPIQPEPTPDPVEIPILPTEPSRGPEHALITIVEYSDFECPYCSRFADNIDEIFDEYEGRIRIVFKQFPLPFHADALLASEAALAANSQEMFWEMHDLLFLNQHALERSDLENYAEQIGLNMDTFRQALDEHTYLEEVQRQIREGQSLGVRGTPAWFVNGVMFSGAQPIPQIRAHIEETLDAE